MYSRALHFSAFGVATFIAALIAQGPVVAQYGKAINVEVPHIASDKSVKWDYDIVYVRVPRVGGTTHPWFAEVFHPAAMDAGGDLMLLHPDGKEELLVAGGKGSVLDPYVSFDGEWVYYSKLENLVDAFEYGWMCDDQRPTLTLTYPRAGKNESLSRILVGMHDHYTGLNMKSFSVTADFAIDGTKAGDNLAARLQPKSQGVWELSLKTPITSLANGTLTVSVRDRQGNISRIVRRFSVAK